MSLDIGDATAAAAAGARDALTTAGQSASERSMSTMAREALFAEALLGALKARVDELKLVAK